MEEQNGKRTMSIFFSLKILTDVLDRKTLYTIGNFIDRCPDQELLPQILEHLIPVQIGEKEPQKFSVPTDAEMEALYEA